MEKLTPAQAQALSLAHVGITEGLKNPELLEWYFVDKLPYNPKGSYIAKVWGANRIYILNTYFPNLQAMMSAPNGRRTICHESVHQVQIQRWGWLQFAIRYALGFVKGGFKYRSNPLEKEAYGKEYQLLTKFESALGVKIG